MKNSVLAVGRGAGQFAIGRLESAARLVLDVDSGPEAGSQPLRDQPRGYVGAAARRQADDDADRLAGKILRGRMACAGKGDRYQTGDGPAIESRFLSSPDFLVGVSLQPHQRALAFFLARHLHQSLAGGRLVGGGMRLV